MSDETKHTPKLELVKEQLEQLDEEEREFARLCRDTGSVQGAADVGLLSVAVSRQILPKNEFFRTANASLFRYRTALVTDANGMDVSFVAVDPDMVQPLIGLGIKPHKYTLYLTIAPRGVLRIIPIQDPDDEGIQNDWTRTKEIALLDGADSWVRMFSDKEAGAFRSYPAPAGRFGEPTWPDIKPAKLFRMAFRDKGKLINDTQHPLVQKWAGRDRDK